MARSDKTAASLTDAPKVWQRHLFILQEAGKLPWLMQKLALEQRPFFAKRALINYLNHMTPEELADDKRYREIFEQLTHDFYKSPMWQTGMPVYFVNRHVTPPLLLPGTFIELVQSDTQLGSARIKSLYPWAGDELIVPLGDVQERDPAAPLPAYEMREFYVAFSIHGSNCFIVANLRFPCEPILIIGQPIRLTGFDFSVTVSRTASLRHATKLNWGRLNMEGSDTPLANPQRVVEAFFDLHKAGWKVNSAAFVAKHKNKLSMDSEAVQILANLLVDPAELGA